MVRKALLTSLLLALGALVAAFVLALDWLLQQRGDGDQAVRRLFRRAVARDPQRRGLYVRAYRAASTLAGSDLVRYVVHRGAALLARLTGRRRAARDQERRAAQHQAS